MVPDDRLYTSEHCWVKQEDGKVRVGISEFGAEQLEDVVLVELPKAGDRVSKGESCAVIESTKSVYDLNSPVSGIVLEVNERVVEEPEILNEDPYEEGWLMVVELEDASEIDEYMNAEEYEEFCGKQ